MTLKSISDWTVTDASASLGPRLDRSNRAEPKSSSHVSCLILFSDSLVVDVNRLKDPFCFVLFWLACGVGGLLIKEKQFLAFIQCTKRQLTGRRMGEGNKLPMQTIKVDIKINKEAREWKAQESSPAAECS